MKRLVILGAGESGIGTAILGNKTGHEVFVSDKGTIAEKYKKVLLNNDIEFEEESHTENKIFNADVVMKSPGIPDAILLVQELKKRGITVISEIEFASRYSSGILIGITGSNGKTTTTMLVNHILKNEGFDVAMGGNIGSSFAQQVATSSSDYHVLELSSFQLDGIEEFAPHIAVLTNITPDHLDRYDYNFENYINSKFKITKNQTEADFLIYDNDDKEIRNWLANNEVKATKLPFSIEKKVEKGVYLEDDTIVINYKKKKKL